MNKSSNLIARTAGAVAAVASLMTASAAPTVSRLTPPSALFSFSDPNPPIIARFLRGLLASAHSTELLFIHEDLSIDL